MLIFNTPEWRLVEHAYPLVSKEVLALKQSIEVSIIICNAMVLFGMAIRNHINHKPRTKQSEACPDYDYQKGYSS